MAKAKVATPSNASKVFVFILVTAGLALLFTLALGAFGKDVRGGDFRNRLVDQDTVQAVRLTDGSVYFGDISFRGETVVIKDAYYVEDVNGETTEATLVEHGTEGYAPLGTINVNYNQVLFWENLQDSSIVTRTIDKNSESE